MIPALCFNCGSPIASKYRAFLLMKDKLFKGVVISNVIEGDGPEKIDLNSEPMLKIFKVLGIDSYCCKVCITTSVMPICDVELLIQDSKIKA